MTQENPPKDLQEEVEKFEDDRDLNIGEAKKLQLENDKKENLFDAVKIKTVDDNDDTISQLKYQLSVKNQILEAQSQKNKEYVEAWDNTPTTSYNIPPKQVPTNRFRNGIMAFKIGLAGILGLGATKEAKAGGGDDSLTKKPVIEKSVSNAIEVKEGLNIRTVSSKERNDWNSFIDFVESKGLQGSEKLDKGSDALAKSLFTEYKKLNPKTTLTYELVPSIQYEMQKLKQNVQGFAERRNDPNAKNLMSFVSKVDGWFGSRTSQSKFPFMIENDYHNNNLVSSENLGLIGADMTPEKKAEMMKKIPKGAKLEKLDGGIFYENEDGDLVKVSD